jgi:dTDP-glucose 4,6-dehydratase
MNNFGEAQDPEKFIPTVIKKILNKEKIEIYTDDNGKIGSRVYLHCEDHASALTHLIGNSDYCWKRYSGPAIQYRDDIQGHVDIDTTVPCYSKPHKFNVCGNIELDNLEVAEMIANIMGAEIEVEFKKPAASRPGYDRRYLLDGTKLTEMGWKPKLNFTERLARVVHWYCNNQSFLKA